MAFQMVYTSVRAGLVAGRSGFCTAARHREIPESLVGRLEDLSTQYDRGTSIGPTPSLPVIYSYRVIGIRDQKYHVLMRVADAGNDYSGRTNHIAHSIILEPHEVGRTKITPAEAILHLIDKGRWIERYEGEARFFEPGEKLDLVSWPQIERLPAAAWEEVTGNAGNAAHLQGRAVGTGLVEMNQGPPRQILRLFAESALLISPERKSPEKLWDFSFTTILQSSRQVADFDWFAVVFNSSAHIASRNAGIQLIELTKSLKPPANRFVSVAEGKVEEVEEKIESGPVSSMMPQGTAPALVGAPTEFRQATLRPGEAPARLLSPAARRSQRKNGKGWVIGVGIVSAILLLGAVLFLRKDAGRKKFETQLSLQLENGKWSEAAGLIDELKKKPDLVDKYRAADNFRKLQGMAECAKKLDEFTKGIPTQPREKLQPILNKLGELGEPMPERLVTLRKEAEKHLKSYEEIESSLNEAWAKVGQVKSPAIDLGKLTEQSKNLGLENQFRSDLEGLKAIQPILTEFAKFPKDGFEDISALKMARQWKEEKQRFVAALSDKFSGEPPGNAIKQLLVAIMKFEPKTKLLATKVTVGEETPKTYLFPANPTHEYSYASIPELASSFPGFVDVQPCQTNLEAQFNLDGSYSNQKIYDKNSNRIFDVDETQKLIKAFAGGPVITDELWSKGFAIGFGTENSKETITRIVVQPTDGPHFLNLKTDKGLTKEGTGTIIRLSGQALKIIGKMEIQAEVTGWELSRSSGVTIKANKPEDLRMDLAGNLKEQIEAKKVDDTELEKYKNAEKEYTELGKKLDEKFKSLKFHKLVITEREVNDKKKVYDVTVHEETDRPVVSKSWADYQKENPGKKLPEYVNKIIVDAFKMGKVKNPFFEEATAPINLSNPDDWGPVGAKNALKVWKEITLKAKKENWGSAKLPEWGGGLTREESNSVENGPYLDNRFSRDFFHCWVTEFSEENLKILERYLLPESRPKTSEKTLQELEEELKKVTSADLGSFQLNCLLKDGKKLRILEITP